MLEQAIHNKGTQIITHEERAQRQPQRQTKQDHCVMERQSRNGANQSWQGCGAHILYKD